MSQRSKSFHYGSERGVSIVPLLIASGLVVTLALVVATYLQSQNKESARILALGSCEQVAQSINNDLLKDQANLFAKNSGMAISGSSHMFTGNMSNTDGLGQISPTQKALEVMNSNRIDNTFGADGTEVDIMVPNFPLQFYNYLTFRNSFNRLIAIARDHGCVVNLGTIDSYAQRFRLINPNGDGRNIGVTLTLALNGTNGTNLCAASGGTSAPTSAAIKSVSFDVSVDYKGEKTCATSGLVNLDEDMSAPTTVVQLENGGSYCVGKQGTASSCANSGGTNSFRLRAATVVSNVAACQSTLQNLFNLDQSCSGSGPQAFATDTVGDECARGDPGAVFFCRIGEANWFKSNSDFWEPCHTARVWGCAGGDASQNTCTPDAGGNYVQLGSVTSVSYLNTVADSNSTDTGSEIEINVGGLTLNRRYMYDVRAVDARGRIMGPSFCQTVAMGGDTVCRNNPNYGVVISSGGPAVSGAITSAQYINTAGNHGISMLPAVITQFGATNEYQCQPATSETFSVGYNYSPGVPLHADSFNIEVGSISGSGFGGSCDCTENVCRCTRDSLTAQGGQSITISVGNDCQANSDSASKSWCADFTTDFNPTLNTANHTTASSNPPNIGSLSVAPAKACGVVSLCPNGPGATSTTGITPRFGTSCPAPPAWVQQTMSGCLSDNAGQICVRMQDPCGRAADSTNRARYDTRTPAVGDNECGACAVPGQVDGNACATGAYCGSDLKCVAQGLHPLDGQDCDHFATFPGNIGDAAEPCRDTRYCTGSPGGTSTCNTQYQCNAGGRTDPGNCPNGLNGSCTISNFCNVSPDEICSGGTRSGFSCNDDSDCNPGSEVGNTCIPKIGTCSLGGAACTRADEATTCPSPSGTCGYSGGVSGKCQPPANTSCGTATSGSQEFCPIMSSCVAPMVPTVGSSCSVPPVVPPNCTVTPSQCVGACGSTAGTQNVTTNCSDGTNSTVSQACLKNPNIGPTGAPCPPDCIGPNGEVIRDGETRNFYEQSEVNCGDTCTIFPRQCVAGVLNGNAAATFNACSNQTRCGRWCMDSEPLFGGGCGGAPAGNCSVGQSPNQRAMGPDGRCHFFRCVGLTTPCESGPTLCALYTYAGAGCAGSYEATTCAPGDFDCNSAPNCSVRCLNTSGNGVRCKECP